MSDRANFDLSASSAPVPLAEAGSTDAVARAEDRRDGDIMGSLFVSQRDELNMAVFRNCVEMRAGLEQDFGAKSLPPGLLFLKAGEPQVEFRFSI